MTEAFEVQPTPEVQSWDGESNPLKEITKDALELRRVTMEEEHLVEWVNEDTKGLIRAAIGTTPFLGSAIVFDVIAVNANTAVAAGPAIGCFVVGALVLHKGYKRTRKLLGKIETKHDKEQEELSRAPDLLFPPYEPGA